MTNTVISSKTREVIIGFDQPFVVIGERINPTGRKLLAEEMKNGDYSRVEADALAQVAAGAQILDVNAGIPLADEPAILAGSDNGANQVEHLLHALASCITTSMVAHAAVRGIDIREMESELEGDIDLNGFLGLNSETPKGFTRIRANFRVKAAAEDIETIESLASFSPVMNTLISGVPVEVSVSPK